MRGPRWTRRLGTTPGWYGRVIRAGRNPPGIPTSESPRPGVYPTRVTRDQLVAGHARREASGRRGS
eukprot:893666-Alexandrium_andersonii.AAC.1